MSITTPDAFETQVNWPANAPGYTLEFAPSLPATVWTVVTNEVRILGEEHVVSLRRQQGFFRLRKD